MEHKFSIDRRPVPLLFLIEYRNAIILFSIIISFFFTINQNIGINGLSESGYKALIIFFLAVILWTLNIIPVVVTSLLIMGLLAVYNVLDSKTIYSFFGNSSVFFILGSFIISAGVKVSGLSKRIAFAALLKYGKTPTQLVSSLFLLSAFMSHIMPEHAVAALMLPIAEDICKVMEKQNPLKRYLFLSVFWGCITGGVVTYLGGARNPLAVGILNEMTGANISFTKWWLGASLPLYILMGFILVYLRKKIKSEINAGKISSSFENNALYRLKKISFNEIKAGFILVITVGLWIFYNEQLGISNIALLSASLYFVLNVVKWEEVNREINWGVLFMYGGAIAIGSALNKVGVLEWFVKNYINSLSLNHNSFLALLILSSIFLTELVSNSAVIVILLPVAINVASSFNLNPTLITMATAIPSGLSYIFPISSPVVAMVYSTKSVDLKTLVKSGLALKFISVILLYIFIKFYLPVIGV